MPVTQRQSEATARKKFGTGKSNNVNKLVKPSPTVNGRFDRSERNGLLLLSTKKSSAGGLLSSKPTPTLNKPMSHLTLQAQSNTSTHQVLLSAVKGAAKAESHHSQPDAWGMAEKQHTHVSLEMAQMEEHLRAPADDSSKAFEVNQIEESRHHEDEGPRYEVEASWDEYGGRGAQTGKVVDEGAAHVARHSKERNIVNRQEEDQRVSDQRSKTSQGSQELDEKPSRPLGGGARKLWDPEEETRGRERAESDPVPPEESEKQQVIHLTSYEDRDRGMRNGTATPRMLFDPKSGSMVEVKSNDDGTKSKRSGKVKKPRHPPKDRQKKAETPRWRNESKGRKESFASERSEAERSMEAPRRLPRTCGVLYGRTEKGNLYCQDEIDGDLGYGCHSVPGGRVRNHEAYQKFVDEHAEIFQKQKDLLNGYDNGYGNESAGDEGLALDTGFNLEDPPEPLEWIKADDKIELITGADDSPTLKPTAKAWAPSQAALAAAAAAAAAEQEKFGSDFSLRSEDVGEDEIEDEDDGHSGLGFDPTQEIDFMSSPSHFPSDAIASVDLQALSLEPAYQSSESATKTNIFAFGSTTWGSSGANESGVLGWGGSTGSENGGLFSSDVFRSGADEEPAGFLSTPSTHSWGSNAIPGLGNLSANHESSGTMPDG